MSAPEIVHYNDIPITGLNVTSREYDSGRKCYFIGRDQCPGQKFPNVATAYLATQDIDDFQPVWVFNDEKDYEDSAVYDGRVTLGPDQAQKFAEFDDAIQRVFESTFQSKRPTQFLPATEERKDANDNSYSQLRIKMRIGKGSEDVRGACEIHFVNLEEPRSESDSGVRFVKGGPIDHESKWERAQSILRNRGRCCMVLRPNVWASSTGRGLHYQVVRAYFIEQATGASNEFDGLLRPGQTILTDDDVDMVDEDEEKEG